jgi:Glycosyl hydrolases family 28
MTLNLCGSQGTPWISRRSMCKLSAFTMVSGVHAAAGQAVAPVAAAGDGVTLDTRPLQDAIDRCAAAGGGQVVLGPGRYLTGTLRLKDRVTLVLESGAVLLGSPHLTDYPVLQDAIPSYTSNYTERCLIRADGARDVAIAGNGTIDGNGTAFAGEYKVRPFMLRFIGCHGVHVEGITLRNPAMWTQHYLDCEDVLIDGVRVRSRRKDVNNDGIDVDSCRRVRIASCDIDAGDDAIVLKATASSACRDVVVTNCVLSTLCNAFKLGTESEGGFENIVFSNSVIYDTVLAGIALEAVDGGSLSRVSISNIVMRNTAYPIFLRLGDRGRPVAENAPRPGVQEFSGVSIRGVIAETPSPTCCVIAGIPNHPIRDVELTDLQLTAQGGGALPEAGAQVPEKADTYPEARMFGALPTYGIYCRHVRGLSLRGVTLRTVKAPGSQPALFVEDAEGLTVSSFGAPAADSALMEFRDVRRARIRETQTYGSGQVLLHLKGSATQDVAIAPDQREKPAVVADAAVKTGAWWWAT